MKSSRAHLIRYSIMFWIIFPFVVSVLLIALIEIMGRFGSEALRGSASGIVFLSGVVPIVAAHLTFSSASFGIIGLFFGLSLDWKFLVTILIGLAFGVLMLHGIYLN